MEQNPEEEKQAQERSFEEEEEEFTDEEDNSTLERDEVEEVKLEYPQRLSQDASSFEVSEDKEVILPDGNIYKGQWKDK